MIVVFGFQAENQQFPTMPLAELMLASVRQHMPQAKIIQFTTPEFPALEGVDEVLRQENKGDFIEWAFRCLIALIARGEPILQIATDVLLNADVSNVFEHEFDVASSIYPTSTRSDGAFCGDVNFIKPSQFYQEVYDYYVNTPEIMDGWEGGQTAFLHVAKTSNHKVLALPFDEYCNTPDNMEADISMAKILHFRGPRKALMPNYADKIGLVKPFAMEVVYNVPEQFLMDNINCALNLGVEILANQYFDATDEELLIIGGGPSLEDSITEIALKQKSGAKIWALNNTFRYLSERGIEPDAHVLLDARPENIEFVPEKTTSLLLYSAQCHVSVLEKGMKAGKVVIWCPSVAEIVKVLNEHKKLAAVIQGGSTVGLKAIALSHLFGFKHIHLYGYDSSYRKEKNHAYAQTLNDKENVYEITFEGRKFTCAPWMITQMQEFQKSLPNFLKMGLEISVHGEGLLPYAAQMMSQ